jgi:HPt (histidine-containing phosphotransfer) domain-containing protein
MSISFKLSTPPEIKSVMLAKMQESMGDIAEDLLPELALMLLEDAPGMFGELHQAIDEGKAPQVKELAHTLKGSCASMGIMGLAKICQEIENSGRDGELANASAWLEYAHAEYAQVKLVLDDYLV